MLSISFQIAKLRDILVDEPFTRRLEVPMQAKRAPGKPNLQKGRVNFDPSSYGLIYHCVRNNDNVDYNDNDYDSGEVAYNDSDSNEESS